MFNAAVV